MAEEMGLKIIGGFQMLMMTEIKSWEIPFGVYNLQ